MPRASDNIQYYETYAERLRDWVQQRMPDHDVHLYNRSQGGFTIGQLFHEYTMDSGYFGSSSGDICIIQCGVVDCAPRPVDQSTRRAIRLLPAPLRNAVIGFLHNHRSSIQRYNGQTYRRTEPEAFGEIYRKWLTHAIQAFSRVYALNIRPISDRLAHHSFGFRPSIELYNSIIADVVSSVHAHNLFLIDVYRNIRETPLEGGKYTDLEVGGDDGYHITRAGHELYLGLIIQHESAYMNSNACINRKHEVDLARISNA